MIPLAVILSPRRTGEKFIRGPYRYGGYVTEISPMEQNPRICTIAGITVTKLAAVPDQR
jgi:hypothetical protein